ncbi:Wall-associated receptor kinase, galacturonan-binding domain [Dillenia turbinata]|uniref:RING-type E3 ubiquitin transferase n=1 Tax=Dillenia turbinata TaxID=194707 RepID=A0AAN8WD14_9MAGN
MKNIFILIFLFLFFSSLSSCIEALDPNCQSLTCNESELQIKFPFSITGLHPIQCIQPGFELFCKKNSTIISFPSFRNLLVKSIAYGARKLDLLDPKSCVHEVFLNLDISLLPFEYYYVTKNYTYWNCSAMLPSPFNQVPCLSRGGYYVYVMEPSLAMPASCVPLKTLPIPFSYTPYASDNSFGLQFTWELPKCRESEGKGGCSHLQSQTGAEERFMNQISYKVFGFGFVGVLAVALIGIKVYQYKAMDKHKEKENQLETEDLLGNFKILNPAKCSDPESIEREAFM